MNKFDKIGGICIVTMLFNSLVNIASGIGVNTQYFQLILSPINLIGGAVALLFLYIVLSGRFPVTLQNNSKSTKENES